MATRQGAFSALPLGSQWRFAAYPTGRLYGLPPWAGFALPVAAALYVAMTVDSARCHWTGRGGVWKSRVYAPERGDG